MFVDGSSPVPLKRRRHTNIDPMEAESAKAKLAAAKERFGREICVFETSGLSSLPTVTYSSDEPDDFYDFTAEDYYRILANKKEVDDAGAAYSGPFLQEDVMPLKGLEIIAEQPEPVQSAPEPATVISPSEPKPAGRESVKPKWLKL